MGEEYLQYGGNTVVEQQSALHGGSRVFRDDKKRGVVVKDSPRVQYINVEVVQMKCEPAELVVELDMPGVPLSHAMDSETEVKHYYDDVQGEVLGKMQISLESFLLLVSKETYRVAKQKRVSKEHSVSSRTEKKGKLDGRRVLERCSDPHLPTLVLGVFWMYRNGSKCQQIVFNYCVIIYISRLLCACATLQI